MRGRAVLHPWLVVTMKLYLIQHAEAKPKQDDPERPLTDAGVEAARRVARFLRDTGAVSVAEVRHSTKRRAKETAEILIAGLGVRVSVREVPDLEPLDDVAPVAKALASEPHDLMLVGHLPHLNRLASRLVCGDERAQAFEFRQGGVLCLERPARESAEEGASAWVVRWMLVPELLR